MARLHIARHARRGLDSPNPDAVAGGAPRPAGVRIAVLGVGGALLVAVTGIWSTSTASADPSASAWHRLRVCESGDNYSINTGNGHYGAYQFDLPTWRSVGGSGYPDLASPAEQDARALILYRMRGWQPWQCTSIIGLREDTDARSGRTNDIHLPDPTDRNSASEAPRWPGVDYTYGDDSPHIRQWQQAMISRGAPLTAPGHFGPKTLAAVTRIQQLNHLPVTGILGPRTWPLAWTGDYERPA